MEENIMSETNNQPDDTAVSDQPAESTDMGATDSTDWKAEAEKWKALARKHEKGFKTLSSELDAIKASQMSEAEKAVAEAEARGRAAALAETGPKLAKAALAAEAAKAGVTLPDDRFINFAPLVSESGEPDTDAIASFVKSLPKPNTSEFTQDVFKGSSGGSGSKVRQLTREDLSRMTNEEINAAREKGQLNALLGIA
ncbi:hypothetical protein GCM10010466_29270 [Planomonospora alba]|uniref:Scaffolding protein n=1 Tax=Planomonospora alba TaxID=161354 RepID=A0ABP6N777_9ACTN